MLSYEQPDRIEFSLTVNESDVDSVSALTVLVSLFSVFSTKIDFSVEFSSISAVWKFIVSLSLI